MKPLNSVKMKPYKKIEITEIPDLVYEGYYWYSDREKPELLKDEKITAGIFTKIPFIIEANFYSKEKNISVSVKNIDGEYLITLCDLEKVDKKNYDTRVYMGHDIQPGKFRVAEIWEETKDPQLDNMTTLVPAYTAFTGFVND
ncbi:MAG: TIGR04423 family type III CRISPR-associated protein [Bacteroidales bacterium]|nr:TIGR04423 family type III CRISPR-associated protein [Bacteroidales bacterium]